ncbi:nucleoside diphosphate kinase [Petrotoga miotherma DSM 10691]|uniref:Nucleoside diphosphate kinase n=1 Tax=Petrotoga miotherma DSM 10691 TaxID=1434326 RepID=A0A2K1PI59_9BACT|nr:nucleoside-diphosphate kinase [Petrotoga miotherma]PNS02469.1 nucleoside diphosphate kinase [Petrotoga miotherma DSM 10691]
MAEKAFVMIKPNAVKRGLIGEIIKRYEQKGLKVVAMKMIKMKKEQAEELYKVHQGKDFYQPLIEFILSGPVVVMILEGPRVIEAVRSINGETDPLKAQAGSIRGEFGISVRKNIVHASDSIQSAEQEWGIFFEENEIFEYLCGFENEL